MWKRKSSFHWSEVCLKQDLRELKLSVIGRGELQLKSDWLRERSRDYARNKSSEFSAETGLDLNWSRAHKLLSYLVWTSLCRKDKFPWLPSASGRRHDWAKMLVCLWVRQRSNLSHLVAYLCACVSVCVCVLVCTYMHCSNRPCWPHSPLPSAVPRHEQCVFLPHFIFLKLNRFINLANCV